MAGKGKSPYRRYDKAPYRYSAEYQAWRNAVQRGDANETARADAAWRRRHAPAPPQLPVRDELRDDRFIRKALRRLAA